MPAPLRLYVVDNYQTFRDGLALAVQNQPAIRWLDIAESAAQVLDASHLSEVDVAVINIDLPDRSGLEVCRWLVSTHERISVLLLSYNNWDVYLVAAQSARAAGFILRESPSSTLIQQCLHAKNGPIYSVEQQKRIDLWKSTVGGCLDSLRQREWQILWLVVEGANNKDIAKTLNLKENTVEKHMTNLMQKLDVKSRSKLTNFVLVNHLDALRPLGLKVGIYV